MYQWRGHNLERINHKHLHLHASALQNLYIVYARVSAHQLPSAESANALHWTSLATPKHLGVQGPCLHVMLAHNAHLRIMTQCKCYCTELVIGGTKVCPWPSLRPTYLNHVEVCTANMQANTRTHTHHRLARQSTMTHNMSNMHTMNTNMH